MNVGIIAVGDELLLGQVVDTNSAWMGLELAKYGIDVKIKSTVGDDLGQIFQALDFVYAHTSVVLMTGGLGPTKDDVTKKALAQYFDCNLVFSDDTFKLISEIFRKRQLKLTEAHRQQCLLPEKAMLLPNKMGTAPGMWLEEDGKIVVSMPGVPYEMKYVMEHGVIPKLANQNSRIFRQKTIRTAGIGESAIAELVEPELEDQPVKIAYLPSSGQVRLRISADGSEISEVEDRVDHAVGKVLPVLERYIFGYDEDTLEAKVGELLMSKGLKLCTAESCTGGYLAHMITSVPGSSGYYEGSLITYSNQLKEELLGVDPETLVQHGAVSESTVRAMVIGALRQTGADLAVSVSGISGPSGGTPDKPVGTVWIAVGDQKSIEARKFLFTKDRLVNIKYTAIYALIMVRNFLLSR